MAQEKDVLTLSNNQISRAYNSDGVLTPGAGLEEYFKVDVTTVGNNTFNLNNETSLRLDTVIVSPVQDSTATGDWSLEYQGYVVVDEQTINGFVVSNIGVIFDPSSVIEIVDSENSRTTQLFLKRVALMRSITI